MKELVFTFQNTYRSPNRFLHAKLSFTGNGHIYPKFSPYFLEILRKILIVYSKCSQITIIIYPVFYFSLHKFAIYSEIHPLREFWKINFGILAENFGKMLEILRKFLRYFEIILWKRLEYFYEISGKL